MEEDADKSCEYRIMSYDPIAIGCGVKKGITIMCMGGGQDPGRT